MTASPQPSVMLVNPPWMISPGLCVGKSITMATTPVPNRISTNVPRNSATNSANNDALTTLHLPEQVPVPDREVVYQASRGCGNVSLELPLRAAADLKVM